MPPYWQHGPIRVRKGNFVFCDSVSMKQCSIYGAILLVWARLRRQRQESANTYLPLITETQKKCHVFQHWSFSNFRLNILNTRRKSNANVCSTGELWIKKKLLSLYTNSASPHSLQKLLSTGPRNFLLHISYKNGVGLSNNFLLMQNDGRVIFTLCAWASCHDCPSIRIFHLKNYSTDFDRISDFRECSKFPQIWILIYEVITAHQM
jgi:hypothetical protein